MRRPGFTLIELIVVLTILGVLAAMSVPVMHRAVEAPAGSRAGRLRSRAVLSGHPLVYSDSVTWQHPAYATPDGMVFADSAAGIDPFNGASRGGPGR